MSTLQMEIPHQLEQQEAQNRIQSVLKNVEARFAGQVKDLQQDWNGNSGTFSFNVMGMPVSGTLTVNNGNIALDSKLPMAAAMFQGKIKSVILEEAQKVLGK
jgi:hypothetical protein